MLDSGLLRAQATERSSKAFWCIGIDPMRGAVARKANLQGQSDAEYWRERAREAREQSVARRDMEGKCAFQRIAEKYDELAEQAESIHKARVPL